jgi:hypothetical protein
MRSTGVGAGGVLADARELRQRITRWRQARGRRSPLPEDLWRSACAVADEVGCGRAAQALGVSVDSLRRWGAQPRRQKRPARHGGFVDLGHVNMASLLGTPGCVVQVAGPKGVQVTLWLGAGQAVDVGAVVSALAAGGS